MASDHKGGRLARNPRPGNLAESLAVLMFRPFCAVAPVPREEDFGIDFVGTLLRVNGKVFSAEQSFGVQVKTHTAAKFEFVGEGLDWLRGLAIPYFPVIANLETGIVALYTLAGWRWVITDCIVNRFVFRPVDDVDHPDDFPLHDPLMTWSLADCSHPEFHGWAYSILRPALAIEMLNCRYGEVSRFRTIEGSYVFDGTGAVANPPVGELHRELQPWQAEAVLEAIGNTVDPFVKLVTNRAGSENCGPSILRLREALRELGFDPDPQNSWDELIGGLKQ